MEINEGEVSSNSVGIFYDFETHCIKNETLFF